MKQYELIEGLIANALDDDLITNRDWIYVRNQILQTLGLDTFASTNQQEDLDTPTILEHLIDYAVVRKWIPNTLDQREQLAANIMNCFLDKPSQIQKKFDDLYVENPKSATNYFYRLSQASNYIQTKQIAKNVSFKTNSDYCLLDITINLSKPEKDPKQIEREKAQPVQKNAYPKCFLCLENEGYGGRINHPARANHRIIELDLVEQTWYFQYSPYLYYPEHSIVFSHEHRDMKIDINTFQNLLAFVNQFPHYFIGSNADLPIVGGSILTHDHYQAGQYRFAMEDAGIIDEFEIPQFSGLQAQILKWPLAVIRIKSKNKDTLVKASEHILNRWINYSDASVGIIAHTDEIRHNTVTPIARKKNDTFEMDLVLRNNRKNKAYPDGIFHPHADVHHIKKENIGLIEVMGLAVLPGRLKTEIETVKTYLLNKIAYTEIPPAHQKWVDTLKSKWQNENSASLDVFLEKELGYKFLKALEDAGVFKQNETGLKAFKQFISTL